jgi:hypothetical protein
MNNKRLAVKLSVTAALIFTVVGLSGYPTSAKVLTPETTQPSSFRFDALHRYIGPVDDPVATYEGARIVHNVTVDGEKGMRVHANFKVRYGLNVPCMMIAYFYYDDADNTPLKSGNEHYRDKKGNVAATTNFTPAYDPAVYNDLQLFVPYECLNMESGEKYELKFYLALYDKEGGRFFGKSGWYKFVLTMP